MRANGKLTGKMKKFLMPRGGHGTAQWETVGTETLGTEMQPLRAQHSVCDAQLQAQLCKLLIVTGTSRREHLLFQRSMCLVWGSKAVLRVTQKECG